MPLLLATSTENKKEGGSSVSTDFRCVQFLQEGSLFRVNMETRTQNGSGSPGLLRVLRDNGRQRGGDSDPRESLSSRPRCSRWSRFG
ncbi:hypothetical protein SKAU_G00241380 [Synaphobranchus kaupii]|uniref:Uncharacterized protein n=1 Tax=Synaphobranchus kaupii TaxID=118154 RepID=A0A9Q1ITX2_SYNKA|nr:hypothetical protein SKAU_G00241380 [Synaphobranchus kaupii]